MFGDRNAVVAHSPTYLGEKPSHTSTPKGLRHLEVALPQSLSAVYIHLVFSTKDRHPFLRDLALRSEMHAYLGGVSKKLKCPPVIIGGTEDHVHLLVHLGRETPQSELVKEVKRVSSLWVKQRDPALNGFSWQGGYGIFSVSSSNLDSVRDYIANQEEHHRKMPFVDEFRALLQKHGIAWDEQYVWD